MSEPAPETPTATPEAPQAPPEPAPKAPDAPVWDGRVESLPEGAQKVIRDLRKESGDRRAALTSAEQQRQDLLANLATALGIKQDDAPPDPAALQQTLTDREGRIGSLEQGVRERDVELAAWRAASRLGANATALMDSRSFLSAVNGLDPSGDTFQGDLDGAVRKALESNPALRGTGSPAAAGIGSTPHDPDAGITPGMGRLRAGYGAR